MLGAAPRGARRPIAGVLAAGLAVVGVVLIGMGWKVPPSVGNAVAVGVPEAQIAPTATPTEPAHLAEPSATSEPVDVRDAVTGPVLPESDPVAVSIPAIGVRSTLVELGLDAGGAMEVPQDPELAGWYSRGATPGALGPAVIAGHVTWNGAPGVFYRLGMLRQGDPVLVTRDDGTTAVFRVDRVVRSPKSRFPTRTVYGAIDHAGLRLITCGGTYDRSRHRYPDNLVVFARLATVQRA